ncbi:alkaline phosphatase PafA [Flavihumibacter profundi]|jgi:predicted AlkP superfamily pyrophosphatase or phosphodiesterase|uniref:alkaline phosphatase PafA n=1 Tax=Flavihumibacter profundi TaxID=2716883 RepID=UPI001CC5B7DD|nr:alkaline phosphatase PafA [Flavihumibacter profundi]MBZ5859542.1 alkaline phosphatase family protein [Flavihumibacter profundi]
MYKILFLLLSFICTSATHAQPGAASKGSAIPRPKLVVGIVVDQMRWDYLYRYYNRYSAEGGFKRLLNNGFSCENTLVPYVPTTTACGHTSIYTGSVPAINGITGNDWFDYDKNDYAYCTGDTSEKSIGSSSALGKMSPRNLLVTTIGDELRLATNFHSKVVGIALKDRGAILPAGHSANAAFWYDNTTGDWISSSYYMAELPQWEKEFNAKKLVDKYYAQDWTTLFPLNTYEQSAPDPKGFNHPLKQYTGKNFSIISATPHGNSFTLEMAMAAVTGEKLGGGEATDMLTVSLSSPDYIGHAYGPNSIEAEDGFLRLDKDLGDFFHFLDDKIGKGQYLLFLTADHGVANSPGFMKEHKIPTGNFDNEKVTDTINAILKAKTNTADIVLGIINYQVFLDRKVIKDAKLNKDSIETWVMNSLMSTPGVERVFLLNTLNKITLNSTQKEALTNGYFPQRSGDIQILFKPQWIDSFLKGGTTHGVWNPYDAHIPLLWYGWNVHPGKSNREVYMTDIAPTIAAMLHIQMPSGSIGHVIEEVTK